MNSILDKCAVLLSITGCLAITAVPSIAVTASYQNDFRVCAGRMLNVGISADAAASACANALNPRDLASCVVQIGEKTPIASGDALATCRQVRRPNELATCVVGISRNSEGEGGGSILNYCGRSLLPVRFAECVVGFRSQLDFALNKAMQTCISASDQPLLSPTLVPQNQTITPKVNQN